MTRHLLPYIMVVVSIPVGMLGTMDLAGSIHEVTTFIS